MAYNAYQGTIRSYWSHLPLGCGFAGAASAPGRRETVLTPGGGSLYFRMSASNCFAEGNTGADPALSACPP